MLCQRSLGFATSAPQGHPDNCGKGTVAPSIDQKRVAPSTGLGKPGGATWPTDLVVGVRKPAEHPFARRKVPT
jgi:hypothetical protein